MADWKQASIEWNKFLGATLQARAQVGCQRRSAWFRGTKKESYDLVPTLFRANVETFGHNLENVTGKSIYDVLSLDRPKRKQILDDWLANAKVSAQYKYALREQIRIVSEFANTYASTKEQHLDQQAMLNILNGFGYIMQEIDAFHEFKNRSKMTDASSWLVLASMRHHGVPVRLLDWTESFMVALYFTLENYIIQLTQIWSSQKKWRPDGFPSYPSVNEIANLDQPALWILNPFHLGQLSNLHGSIPYPDLTPLGDYYSCLLIQKMWPYKRPIPMHADKASQRIESQRGHFTVHGYCSDPLNIQIFGKKEQADTDVKSTVLCKVRMSKHAAIYGAFFLWQYVNFDRFELFRDFDSLADVVTTRHFGLT